MAEPPEPAWPVVVPLVVPHLAAEPLGSCTARASLSPLVLGRD